MWFWKTVLCFILIVLLYWGLINAFHLLNLPSDMAVLEGLCLLLLLAAGGFVAFQRLWRL